MKNKTCKAMLRTVINMDTSIKVIRSKKDKLNTRQALNKTVREMY